MSAQSFGLLIALIATPVAYGCDCSEPTVQEARQHSTIVFRGTIIDLRPTTKRASLGKDTGRIAVFRTTRVWKGDVGRTFEMRAIEEFGGCWGFSPQFLKVGAELLVYVEQPDGEYQTSTCSRTRFVKYAAKDFGELGPGEEPKQSTQLPETKSK
jgi:hypothetical protein